MNRILVTGATGTVGRQVVSQLLAAGANVRALTRNPPSVSWDSRSMGRRRRSAGKAAHKSNDL